MASFLSAKEKRTMPSFDAGGTGVEVGAVAIDLAKCTGCGLCVAACPADALEMPEKRKVRMSPGDTGLVLCFSCGDCVAICEPRAIELTETLRYGGYFTYLHRGEASAPRRF